MFFQDVEGVPQRESWMLELPEKLRAGVGLQARKFKSSRSGGDDGDTSSWTDTPADRERRKQVGWGEFSVKRCLVLIKNQEKVLFESLFAPVLIF